MPLLAQVRHIRWIALQPDVLTRGGATPKPSRGNHGAASASAGHLDRQPRHRVGVQKTVFCFVTTWGFAPFTGDCREAVFGPAFTPG